MTYSNLMVVGAAVGGDGGGGNGGRQRQDRNARHLVVVVAMFVFFWLRTLDVSRQTFPPETPTSPLASGEVSSDVQSIADDVLNVPNFVTRTSKNCEEFAAMLVSMHVPKVSRDAVRAALLRDNEIEVVALGTLADTAERYDWLRIGDRVWLGCPSPLLQPLTGNA